MKTKGTKQREPATNLRSADGPARARPYYEDMGLATSGATLAGLRSPAPDAPPPTTPSLATRIGELESQATQQARISDSLQRDLTALYARVGRLIEAVGVEIE